MSRDGPSDGIVCPFVCLPPPSKRSTTALPAYVFTHLFVLRSFCHGMPFHASLSYVKAPHCFAHGLGNPRHVLCLPFRHGQGHRVQHTIVDHDPRPLSFRTTTCARQLAFHIVIQSSGVICASFGVRLSFYQDRRGLVWITTACFFCLQQLLCHLFHVSQLLGLLYTHRTHHHVGPPRSTRGSVLGHVHEGGICTFAIHLGPSGRRLELESEGNVHVRRGGNVARVHEGRVASASGGLGRSWERQEAGRRDQEDVPSSRSDGPGASARGMDAHGVAGARV